MNILEATGRWTIQRLRGINYLAAVLGCALFYALRPSAWKRPVRSVFARQVLFTGVEAAGFTSRIAILVGVSVVVQAQLWLGKVGQTRFLGPILVAVIIRELGPLLANLIVILRSGNAIAAELGIMKVTGEVRVVESQGLDPFLYLVMPRVIAVSLCVFCLTVIFIVVCLVSGYICGVLVGVKTGGTIGFLDSIAGAIGPVDVFNVVIKSLLPGFFSGAICCIEGLSVEHAITEVPPASSRAVQLCVVMVFLVSALVSLVTYV